LKNRFAECGLSNCSSDEAGNALGVLPGTEGDSSILVVAHADTLPNDSGDHTIDVRPGKVVGPGVADNSLGLAVLATLPSLLDKLDINLKSDLILMGASKSLGRGNLEGLRFFLANNNLPIRAGVCLEGVQLGRLSIGSIGMVRCEIRCEVPEEYDWTLFEASGAIVTLNDIISRLLEISLPRKPRTSIVLGSIEGGTSFNTQARSARLRFEIRSESVEMVEKILQQVEDIVAEIYSQSASQIALEVVARRDPGGIAFGHPLSRQTRIIMETLGIKHRKSPSTSELSTFIDRKIPAVTVGITSGEMLDEHREVVNIDRMAKGLAQVLGMLLAIDGGFCDERS
jgi:acetylornithine deacetylase/succinyl-diaminopimelate desuccinylase-like protein